MDSENKFFEGNTVYLLPPNPGPFASLEQWIAWRDELLALGSEIPGVDVELAVAELAIKDLRELDTLVSSGQVGVVRRTEEGGKRIPCAAVPGYEAAPRKRQK